MTFWDIGEPVGALGPQGMVSLRGRTVLQACINRRDFEVVEIRRIQQADSASEIIIAECIADGIPSRNQFGIHVRERIAIVIPVDMTRPPDVRAIRKDFPVLAHLNHSPNLTGKSLCLYFEAWSTTRRSWTPEKFLSRITWWLSKSASGALHRDDQPVEQIYYRGETEVVLPHGFTARALRGEITSLSVARVVERPNASMIVTKYAAGGAVQGVRIVVLGVSLAPIVHGAILDFPTDLAALDEQWAARGSSIADLLRRQILESVTSEGIAETADPTVIALLLVPVCRTQGGDPERVEIRGVGISLGLGVLGQKLGCLVKSQGKFFQKVLLGDGPKEPPTDLRDVQICLLEVTHSVSKTFARETSKIDEATLPNDRRVLAGVGSLGSALAEIWSREAWGEWTLVDHDYIRPHNTIRHIAGHDAIGYQKVRVVKSKLDAIYADDTRQISIVPQRLFSLDDALSSSLFSGTTLFVDATTTLDVPRDYSLKDDVPRGCSVFFVPSGDACVLLMEDASRRVRLDLLEARYYAAVLQRAFGDNHLKRPNQHVSVGAGCREISFQIGYGTVLRHASLLSQQVRLRSTDSHAQVCVWTIDEASGQVRVDSIHVGGYTSYACGGWTVLVLDEAASKMRRLRSESLPNETGGAVVGYADHVSNRLFVVDVLDAPPDSTATPTGFVRGTDGLAQALKDVEQRTAGQVGFIGEWHSHPMGYSARPSTDDIYLLSALGEALATEGEPALMIIVSESEMRTYLASKRPAGEFQQ